MFLLHLYRCSSTGCDEFGVCHFSKVQWLMLGSVCVKVIEERLIMTSRGGLRYVGEWKNGRVEHKMDHLACFIGSLPVTILHEGLSLL